ncbi:hypothetical protein ACQKMI_22800 [Lysinibacillus sp. NPDC097214]|uniref:hypothetical protein n=1 Tax=Lysinibacillus sp. NPDC097214 TaxID=3390584 RepID=UPI003D0683BB
MEHLNNIKGLPQSIPLHHYEQFIDETIVKYVRDYVLKNINEPIARQLLRNNCQQYQLFASELILEIARQQHQTAHFSISAITHKNALIALLAEQVVCVGTLMQNATSSEEFILLTEHYPRLVAVLQMMYLKEAELPCFVETKNVLKELENELFPLLQQTLLVNVNDIEDVQSDSRVPADVISRDEFYKMAQVGRWDTLLAYVRHRLNRNLTKHEEDTLFKITEDVELTYQMLQIIAGK